MNVFDAIFKMTSGLAVAGLVTALVTQILRIRYRNYREAIERAAPIEAVELASDAVQRFDIPMENLAQAEVDSLARWELDIRERRALCWSYRALFASLVFASVAAFSIWRAMAPDAWTVEKPRDSSLKTIPLRHFQLV